ncbi:HNH endonuclease [Nocardiopsis lambiniae]|uniref:HNH endonuclease signature motif containing protein n=1 Tax=Nocardiopsis lambiniae TaxID=3075539 RepID=A0ABU2MBN5_9ACTN|nr:HNH endonuclease signature motif containing protein [Nocardiopsis sp. DSM 44743]MDT0330022.1 HNH endonuclease signature motif containing protein [Nocardiopsis sp. DSM 44743]
MKAYVGVTDRPWAEFLAQRPHLKEINFWRPSSEQGFGRIGTGDLFLFKTKYPHNRIVGGAVFSEFARVPISRAWEAFGEGNGRESPGELRDALNRYRVKNGKPAIRPGEDPLIGCIMLRDPVFFDEGTTFPAPPDFAKNQVQGQGFDDILGDDRHAAYFTPIAERILTAIGDPVSDGPENTATWEHDGPTRGGYGRVRRRLGQQAFKLALLEAYAGRCAVTGLALPPALEAAHIHPVADGGLHRLDNGLLLRADLHKLFDAGYIAVSPDFTVRVSPRLHTGAAEEYTALEGIKIRLPENKADRPAVDALRHHMETVFI